MIPYLTVNGEGLKRLMALVSLDEQLFVKLGEALQDELDTLSARPAILAYAEQHVPESSEQFSLAIEAVVPLLLRDDIVETGVDDLISGVVAAITRSPKKEAVTASQVRILRRRLGRLLRNPAIRLRSKTWNLVLERPCVFRDGRILTDLRPIFSDKNPAALEACSVIHTLIVSCKENDATKTVHVALDMADLASLKVAIARAEQKQKLLTEFASKSGVPILQIK